MAGGLSAWAGKKALATRTPLPLIILIRHIPINASTLSAKHASSFRPTPPYTYLNSFAVVDPDRPKVNRVIRFSLQKDHGVPGIKGSVVIPYADHPGFERASRRKKGAPPSWSGEQPLRKTYTWKAFVKMWDAIRSIERRRKTELGASQWSRNLSYRRISMSAFAA